jgi:predicted MFS family arabinose efflux permease
LWILAACLCAAGFAPSLGSLLALRFCAGLAAGGVIPACMASLGDLYAGPKRSIAISRFVTVGLVAQIFSASLAGVLASILGWRSVFFAAASVSTAAALAATFLLVAPRGRAAPFSFPQAARNYRTVFANPRAPLCFGTVFLEGVALFGVTPYIASLLRAGHLGDAREAGVIIGAMGVGGIVYSFVLPLLLKRLPKYALLGIGGVIATIGPLTLASAPAWPVIAAAFLATGFGYMLMHNSIQSEAVELAPKSRVSAYSMHAFSFFIGQSLGPIFNGWSLRSFGPTAMLIASAAILAATGLFMSWRFGQLSRGG